MPNRLLRLRSLLAILAAGYLIVTPASLQAHPMGNFSISHYAGIRVQGDFVEITYLKNLEEALLKETEYVWNDAILKQDVEAAAKCLAEDYVLVGMRSTGSGIVDRHTWLKNLHEMRIHTYQTEVIRTRLYGDSGVISVVGSLASHFRRSGDSRKLLPHRCLERTFRRREGGTSPFQPLPPAPQILET